jgi:hypothetical protein
MARYLTVLATLALLSLVPLSSQAAMITYDTSNRPILFEDIDLSGTMYDVEVEWGTTYINAYPTPGMFMGTNYSYDPVLSATNALGSALEADEFTALGGSNKYLINPTRYGSSGFGTVFGGRYISLHNGPEAYGAGAMVGFPNTTYPNIGFTHWEAVPLPSTIWLLGSVYMGLVGFRRKRRKG